MKTFFKLLGWLIGLAVLLVVTGHFTLRHALNTPKFKAAATGFIERSTGRLAAYEYIDYTLFPFSLVVQNASLKEKNGRQDFASMKELSLFVDFKTKEVTSVLLDTPSIRIVQHPDGTFNFSDLFPAPAAGEAPTPKPETSSSTTTTGTPAPSSSASPPAEPFAIRLVQIRKAHVEFIALDEENNAESVVLSNIDFQLKDFAPDLPFHMKGSAALGKSSSMQFELSGPPLVEYAHRIGTWPIALDSRLDIVHFSDIQAFLPPETLPFESLWMTLNIQGALSDKLNIHLHLKTPDATESHPVSFDVGLRTDLSLPEIIAQHLLTGTHLPESRSPIPPACTPPPGSAALAGNPALTILLQQVQATLELTFPKIAYANNCFSNGSISAFLRSGVLTVPQAKLSAYGGTLDARGNAQLLACPLTYRLDRLVADRLSIKQALDANGLGDLANISGLIHLEGSLSGHALGAAGLRSLEAETHLRIDHLQSVGRGGSLMDQVWMKLDHPLLLRLLPHLESKVDHARQAASTITTSHYDEATATLVLHNGKAVLSGTRLSTPGYHLDLSGAIYPFDDRLDLSARLLASPEETARLTDGKDLSAYLPYEKGGLLIPLFIQGSLQSPTVLPDLDLLMKNALNATLGPDAGNPLDNLSDSDRKNVQQGLQILQGIGAMLLQP